MTIRDWQSLGPAAAAREVHRRFHVLPPAQQRAAFASLLPEAALAQSLAATTAGPLAGVPYLLKDLFGLAGQPTCAGSTFLAEIRPAPSADSAIVNALRAAGAVCAGKTHLHEFAYGITGENPHYGDCEHPHFPGRTTGGSSSGSAAAVAAGIVPFAIGTDTGGSVRLPAAFCGLFGFRLTPRDRFIADAFPLAPSFDTAGWFTAHAADMSLVTQTLCDSAPLTHEPRGCYLEISGVDADVATACRDAGQRLVPSTDPAVPRELAAAFSGALEIYHTIVAAEAWQTHHEWADVFRDRYDPVVWQRLNRGRSLSPGDVAHAQRGLAAIRTAWSAFFDRHDFLALPAAPCGALTKAQCTLENRNRILTLTAPASVGGRPVLTVPVSLPSGLTAGLQIVLRDTRSPVVSWALDKFSS
jgi:amidase/aspartyl-tRNA(Asn)/glutamyl-tRNA(Gln) amidotransferase subunit A